MAVSSDAQAYASRSSIRNAIRPSHLDIIIMKLLYTTSLTATVVPILAGPVAYGVCQAGCSAVVVACYTAAGCTFGTVRAAGAPAAIVGYNSAYGTCQAAFAAVLLAPKL